MITIISTCITAATTLIVCLITQASSAKKTRGMLEYKLDELSKRVDKHNNLIERTYKVEEAIHLHDEKIKVANHRIDDLEQRHD